MTTIDTGAAPRTPALSSGAQIARLIARLAARISGLWADWALRRDTWRQLDRLTDRELDDIGLTRAEVDALR